MLSFFARCGTEGHPGIIDAIAAHDLDDYDTDKYDCCVCYHFLLADRSRRRSR